MTDPFDIEALLASASPRTLEVPVCARGDLVDRHIALVTELAEIEAKGAGSIAGNPELERVSREIVAVEEEQAACTLTFKVTSVSRKQWVDLLGKHPPRKGVDLLDHNTETFPPAAVALCCEQLTVDQAKRLAETIHQGEWDKLWGSVLGLNVAGMPHPKLPAATELARANGNS